MWFKRKRNNKHGVSSMSSNSKKGGGVPSILSPGFKSEGDIVSDGEVHILGSHSGNLVVHKLTLGEGGSITGTIEAESALINGNLSGRLTAVSVALGPTASVTADIVYVSMKMEPGAIYEGYSRRVESMESFSADGMKLSPPQRQQLEKMRGHENVSGSAD
jgi:cytoskeletal protein CcmA (bactofilin family)